MNIERLSAFSILPCVTLKESFEINDGISLPLCNTCRKLLNKNDCCQQYYDKLKEYPLDELVQCPNGFSSVVIELRGVRFVITGFIPYPRLGGKKEQLVSKLEPAHKVSIEAVNKNKDILKDANRKFYELEHEELQNYSKALHEIRKLNRTVKQEAETICMEENPDNPDNAAPPFVRIWKSSEIMSQQFEIIEALANGTLTALPLQTPSEIYKLFHKCVKILQLNRTNINLESPFNFRARAMVCDNTISIIPTVLLTNAIKYSIPDSTINVAFEEINGFCKVSVTSQIKGRITLPNSIYERGVRFTSDKDGAGNGLYIAQQVAYQHKTKICHSNLFKKDYTEVTFYILFEIFDYL